MQSNISTFNSHNDGKTVFSSQTNYLIFIHCYRISYKISGSNPFDDIHPIISV